MADVKWSQFPSQTPGNSDEVVGLHSGDNARFSIANIVAAVRNGLANIFVPLTRTINGKGLSADISLDSSDIDYDNTQSGLTADNVQEAIDELAQGGGGGGSAADITYDPTTSGASATNVQDALDEVFGDLDSKQDEITASGILKGDGQGGVTGATAGTDYQTPLTFDNTPTENSANPVKSGGVYTDVRTRVPVYGKGVNLLRNWYFVGGGTGRGVFPVNQRGQSSYSGPYAIDGWHGVNASQMTLASGYITTASTTYWQDASPEILKMLLGKSVTASALLADGTLVTGTAVYRTSYSGNNVYNYDAQRFLQYGVTNSGAGYQCLRLKPDSYVAVKVELGTEQTLAHQENGVWVLNEIPDYEYELYRCITSTADPSDTYANKSLATEQQLAYVETGTTASQNYTAGQYICWNGLLYTADTAIASGATFYTSGGNKNLTECVGGGFNDVQSFNVSPASGVTINSQSNYKIGNLVFLYSEFKITSDLPAWSPVYTLPFPAFFGSFYLEASGAMPVSQVLYSPNNYTISKGRNALPAGTYLVSVMGYIPR